MLAITWTLILAAQRRIYLVANYIIPHSFSPYPISPVLHHFHAVLNSLVVWFPACPRCEPKEAAVSPRPDAFIVLVVASEPKIVYVFPFHTVQNVFSDGRREDRGQMAILSFAPGFCIIPAIFCRAPKEARIAIFLPAVWARWYAVAYVTPWNEMKCKQNQVLMFGSLLLEESYPVDCYDYRSTCS